MSHNITVKEKCSMTDVQNMYVQNILKKMGWVMMPAGEVIADDGKRDTAEIRIAIPTEQMETGFGHKISATSEEGKQLGINTNCTVIGIKSSEIMVEGQPQKGLEVVGDGYAGRTGKSNVQSVTEKLKKAICAGKGVAKIRTITSSSEYSSILEKTGATNNAGKINSLENELAEAIKTGKKGVKFTVFTAKQMQTQ